MPASVGCVMRAITAAVTVTTIRGSRRMAQYWGMAYGGQAQQTLRVPPGGTAVVSHRPQDRLAQGDTFSELV